MNPYKESLLNCILNNVSKLRSVMTDQKSLDKIEKEVKKIKEYPVE